MKAFKKGMTILLLLVSFPASQIKSQDIIVGAEIGYSKEKTIRSNNNDEYSLYPMLKAGLNVEFSPYYSKFFIISGVSYLTNLSASDKESSQSILIPLKLRIMFGELIQPYFEGGAYYGILLSDPETGTGKNDMGALAGFGLQLKLGKRWRVEASYNYSYGFTPILEIQEALPLNQYQTVKYNRILKGASIHLKYRY